MLCVNFTISNETHFISHFTDKEAGGPVKRQNRRCLPSLSKLPFPLHHAGADPFPSSAPFPPELGGIIWNFLHGSVVLRFDIMPPVSRIFS